MKTIRKSQYNFLKLLEKYNKNRNELLIISDEEYNNLSKYMHKSINIINENIPEENIPEENTPEENTPEENTPEENNISEYIITIPKQSSSYKKIYDYPGSPFIKNGFYLGFCKSYTTQGYVYGIDIKGCSCMNATDIIIPNYLLYKTPIDDKFAIVSINCSAFEYHTNLINIHLNNFINNILDYAFCNCSSLTNINTNNICDIGKYAFGNCSSLKNIILPKSGCKIGKYAFSNCSSLEHIENFSTIPIGAFSGCTSLTSVKITSNNCIIEIESEAFWYCISLKTIEIPSNICSIKTSAFGACSSLENFISYSFTKFDLSDIFYTSQNATEYKTIIKNIYVQDNLINQYQNDNYIIKYNVNVKSISEYIN